MLALNDPRPQLPLHSARLHARIPTLPSPINASSPPPDNLPNPEAQALNPNGSKQNKQAVRHHKNASSPAVSQREQSSSKTWASPCRNSSPCEQRRRWTNRRPTPRLPPSQSLTLLPSPTLTRYTPVTHQFRNYHFRVVL